MKVYVSILSVLLIAVSCKLVPDSNRNYDEYNPDRIYKLQLNPESGSSYYYDISNETEVTLELDKKEVENINKTNVGVIYKVNKDSSGNLIFTTQYDKLTLYSKNGDTETQADASLAATSFNPIEKMLGDLKEATIVATISPGGDIKNVSGYKEVGDKIMTRFAPNDVAGRNMAQAQWAKLSEGLIKKNMNELFKVFPDSAVHVGDTWRLSSKQEGDFKMNNTNSFTLKAINNDVAIIASHGKLKSDDIMSNVMGYGDVTTALKGDQEGEFEMEAKTGMLINCKISADIKGTIIVMGREVPVKISNVIKVKGKRN